MIDRQVITGKRIVEIRRFSFRDSTDNQRVKCCMTGEFCGTAARRSRTGGYSSGAAGGSGGRPSSRPTVARSREGMRGKGKRAEALTKGDGHDKRGLGVRKGFRWLGCVEYRLF